MTVLEWFERHRTKSLADWAARLRWRAMSVEIRDVALEREPWSVAEPP
ncbi:MAG TPA: hypothetical protein VLC49_02545 [Solirubrobacteraceae bacterium]|nr:hypothetical protein [Solirubrobacteraceae bacterium]